MKKRGFPHEDVKATSQVRETYLKMGCCLSYPRMSSPTF